MKGLEFRIEERPYLTVKEMSYQEYMGLTRSLFKNSTLHFEAKPIFTHPVHYEDVKITMPGNPTQEQILDSTVSLIEAVKRLKWTP